jgi:type III secretion system FlhB-like substrate exporter
MLLLLAVAAFAVIDVPLQKWRLGEQLKMSHQEVKQEFKEQEGNAEVKGRMRQHARQMARRRMLAAVPDADLVVMNPTHYAVALKYDEATMAAPKVVAKGTDLLAMKIRDLATEHKVPVLEAPPLARALYANCEIDQEVPKVLFNAVAQVLAWVYQLRQAATVRGARPPATRSRRCRPSSTPTTALCRAAAGVLMKALMQRLQALLGPHAGSAKALTMPFFVVLMLAMMVLPLPPFALDLLFTFNIAMALMVMMVSARWSSRWTSRPCPRCCWSPRCCGCR